MPEQKDSYVFITFIVNKKRYQCSVSSFEVKKGILYLYLWQGNGHAGNYGYVKGGKVIAASACDWYQVSPEIASLLSMWND